jgi:hypothetical protein
MELLARGTIQDQDRATRRLHHDVLLASVKDRLKLASAGKRPQLGGRRPAAPGQLSAGEVHG